MDLNKKKGNDFWKEAEATEMRQLLEYITFIDKGTNCTPTSGYKKIGCHMVYNVKHDRRHKACVVAGGNLTAWFASKHVLKFVQSLLRYLSLGNNTMYHLYLGINHN
jgi:hypothetical protein